MTPVLEYLDPVQVATSTSSRLNLKSRIGLMDLPSPFSIVLEKFGSVAVILISAQSRSWLVPTEVLKKVPSLASSEPFSKTYCASLNGSIFEVVSVP